MKGSRLLQINSSKKNTGLSHLALQIVAILFTGDSRSQTFYTYMILLALA